MGNPFRRSFSSAQSSDEKSAAPQDAPSGLLPSTNVNVATASKPQSEYFNAMAGSHLYSSQLAGHHDASYYENWNRERQEAVARGEDPNAKFLALVAERKARSKKTKLSRLFAGKKAHGQSLSKEEEREALERDRTATAASAGNDEVVG